MSSFEEEFKNKFPSLKGDILCVDYPYEDFIYVSDVMMGCLDKQRVREALRKYVSEEEFCGDEFQASGYCVDIIDLEGFMKELGLEDEE